MATLTTDAWTLLSAGPVKRIRRNWVGWREERWIVSLGAGYQAYLGLRILGGYRVMVRGNGIPDPWIETEAAILVKRP